MPFHSHPGLPGKVYTPPKDDPGDGRKHPCPDCHACQQCSEDRCRVCRCGETDKKESLCRISKQIQISALPPSNTPA